MRTGTSSTILRWVQSAGAVAEALVKQTEETFRNRELLAQARSGLCHEHYGDRPVAMTIEPAA